MGRKVDDGDTVKVTVPENTTVEQGKFYLLDGFFGMAIQSATTGAGETAEVVLSMEEGEYETDQINTGEAFAKGSKVYWDNANKRLTTTATGNRLVGIVSAAKDSNNVIWFIFTPEFAMVSS